MSKIAFFDFDGTITQKDTLLEIIKFARGNRNFIIGFIINIPWLILYKLRFINNQSAKERILSHFFKGMTIAEFEQICIQFSIKKIPNLIRPAAINEMNKLQKDGYEIVIVSASPGNWIRPWSSTYNFETISTELSIFDGKLTGKISGKNCYGKEKVNRIKQVFHLQNYDDILAYGDTKGDIPMLKLAKVYFYKPFRKRNTT